MLYLYAGDDGTVDAYCDETEEKCGRPQPTQLDISPVARHRIADRAHDRFEQESLTFFEAVRSAYLEIAAREERFVIIDAAEDLATVQLELTAKLQEYLTGFER